MTDIEIKCQLYHNLKLDGCFILKILAFKHQIEILKRIYSDNLEKLKIGVFIDNSGGTVDDGYRLFQIIRKLSKIYPLNVEYTVLSGNHNDIDKFNFSLWGRNGVISDDDYFNRIALATNPLKMSIKKTPKRDFKQEKLRTKFHGRNFKR